MDITEKSAYLKGLYEGFGIDAKVCVRRGQLAL